MIKTSLRKAIRRLTGYDIHKATGQDADWDIQTRVNRWFPVIFDVGANEGQTSKRFRELFPTASVFAFEPGSPFETLAALPGVSAHNIALGSEAGTQLFSENSTSVMSSFLPLGPEGWGEITGKREVAVSTVDEFCKQRDIGSIDLLKSDTQGYDLEVLRGSERMFAEKRIKLVYLELTFAPLYENLPRFDQLYGFLTDRDFDLVGLYDLHYRNDKLGWADALFAHRQAILTHADAPRQRT
jgi:FkbM family methyltransferase